MKSFDFKKFKTFKMSVFTLFCLFSVQVQSDVTLNELIYSNVFDNRSELSLKLQAYDKDLYSKVIYFELSDTDNFELLDFLMYTKFNTHVCEVKHLNVYSFVSFISCLYDNFTLECILSITNAFSCVFCLLTVIIYRPTQKRQKYQKRKSEPIMIIEADQIPILQEI
jgi:hypothetical protein